MLFLPPLSSLIIFPAGPYIPGYITSWKCFTNSGSAFVDGGMKFNHTLRALVVPTCGYYYISSSVNFFVDTEGVVFHKLKVTRNCPQGKQILEVFGPASSPRSKSQVTTYADEVVMLCAGSTIQVIVPHNVPCCGIGLRSYINAFLVARSNCTSEHAQEHAITIF